MEKKPEKSEIHHFRVPHGERGIVVDVQILDSDKGDELGPGVIKKVIVQSCPN